MNTQFKSILVLAVAILSAAFSVHGLIPDDADGDGVPDSVDVCPAEDASGFDRDGDGCIDAFVGARHIEYWSTEDAVIPYVINEQGVPSITNGSDLTAVQAAFNSWLGIADTDLNFVYNGTTAQTNSDGLDQVNLVTFVDNAYPFSNLVLAVGLSTSFETDTLIAGRVYKKGEIFDADMVFNPTKVYKVGGAGPGVDVQSVATHEAGHLFGISHSAIQSSTMFYVLPGGNAARTLELDDELVFFKAYGDPAVLATSNRIDVSVRDGSTNDPIPGAIVFVIDTVTQDTVGCDYTLPNGEATFPGLPSGDYFVAIHPLNGTAPIGFIAPANINVLVAEIAADNFAPEFYDAAESNQDNPSERAPLTVSGGSTVRADLFTNIDVAPPTVVSANPADGSIDVAIDAAYRIEFSEPIDDATLGAAFSFRDVATNTPQPGSLVVLRDDSVVVYIPSPPLAFGTDYTLRFDQDLEDKAGNSIGTVFTLGVTTENEPAMSISSLAPSKGIVGATVVINGQGFEIGATVDFGGVIATVESMNDRRIVTSVPEAAVTGLVTVTNPDMSTSNQLSFTVLTIAEVARGWDSGQTTFDSSPNAIAVTPNGDYAYVATAAGVEAIVVNSSLPEYLVGTSIPSTLGFDDIAVIPSGARVYAVSESQRTMVEIMSDPTTGLLFNTILSSRSVGAEPRGIVIDPAGDRAYIATDEAEVQVWDLRLDSPNYRQQIGFVASPGGVSVAGAMAMTPAGDRLLFATDAGDLHFYDPSTGAIVATVNVGLDVRGIVVEATGERAYVTHESGDISVVNLQGVSPFQVQDIATGGSLRGLAITPGASYLYAADRALDNLKVVDLAQTNATFRTAVAEIPAILDPVDVAISPDGFYAFSIMQGEAGGAAPRMLVSTIGIGPTLEHINPIAGPPGTVVVLGGSELGNEGSSVSVRFNGIEASSVTSVTYEKMIVVVPDGATTGPVTVEVIPFDDTLPTEISNPLSFQVTGPSSGSLRFAGTLEPTEVGGVEEDIEVSPKGDVVFVRYGDSGVRAYDIRPGSPDFHKAIRVFSPANLLDDVEITADGKTGFFADLSSGVAVGAFVADPNDPNFAKLRPISMTGFCNGGYILRANPDNVGLLVYDSECTEVTFWDALDVSQNVQPQPGPSYNPPGFINDIIFHPSGNSAFLATSSPDGVQVLVTNPNVGSFGTGRMFAATGTTDFPRTSSLAITPDGRTLYLYTVDVAPRAGVQEIHIFDVLDSFGSHLIAPPAVLTLGLEAPPSFIPRDMHILPTGDRAIRSAPEGFVLNELLDLTTPITPTIGSDVNLSLNDFGFTPDGSRVYVSSPIHGFVRAYDFAAAANMLVVSGNNQSGVSGDVLPAPIRVRVIEPLFAPPAQGAPGVAVTFQATSGNGLFEIPCGGGTCYVSELIVVTDEEGYAEANWYLSGATGVRTVQAIAEGILGSPANFNATVVVDPNSLPLTVAEIIPPNNATGISVSTAALVTFSRPIDAFTIDPSSLFIQTAVDATLVPVSFGYTDSDRKVSLTPLAPLAPDTEYQIVTTANIEASSGGDPLSNPGTTVFETQTPPPLAIRSIYPPSALAGTPVTISGTGFDAGPNTVNFGSASATGLGTSVSLTTTIPVLATPGTVNVTVTDGIGTSNAFPFTILPATTTVIDEVIANIASGSAKSVVVSGDGALCYAVGTDGDVVIPVGIEDEFTYPSIPVGDQPVAIVIDPAGDFAYVANFNSGNVSVIDVDPTSSEYHTVVETITAGRNPIDVAVAPDGSRVAVANAGSNDVSLIDSDPTSVTYNQVVANVGAGGSAKSVVISADGTLYVATTNGVLVLDASNNVIANIASGSAKSVVVSADGTLLFVLTTDGIVQIVDIQDESPSENQVVANVGAGGSAKSVVVSADGTFLYIVQEDTDEVIVVAIDVIPGVGAIDPDAAASFTIETRLVATLQTGDDPSDVAIDPLGSGRVVVTNEGDGTLTVFGRPFSAVPAMFKIVPGIIIPKLPGFYVLGLIQLPVPYSVHDIDIATVRVFDTVHVAPGKFYYGDVNFDGVEDLSVLFCRDEFLAAMPENGEHVSVVVKGEVGGEEFEGEDGILVLRPTILTPEENERLVGGQPFEITWTAPLDVLPCDKVKIEWRHDGDDADDIDCDFHHAAEEESGGFGGASEMDMLQRLDESADASSSGWIVIANHVANDGDYTWNVPAGYYPNARLRITLLWFGFKVGSSEVPFMIEMPVPVRLKSFDVTMEDGSAVLRWETSLEVGMAGYDVVRSEQELGRYDVITKEMVRSSGAATGGSYEYKDENVTANRTYWYKLREVAENGLGSEYGPYSVTYRVSNQLDQNVPNPFNPTTTIRYGIAADGPVSLLIYDVAGRKVRTLVNQRQRADIYSVTWDGINDAGQRTASGVYFYKLVAGKFTQTKKMVLLK